VGIIIVMLRLLWGIRGLARFSKIALTEGTEAEVAGMGKLSSLPFYRSFR
jgi:hypothetical protein